MKTKNFFKQGFIIEFFSIILKKVISFLKLLHYDNYSILNYFSIIYTIFVMIFAYDIDYGAFQFLRFVVSGFALWTVFKFKNDKKLEKFLLPFMGLAILFNPVLPITLDQELWQLFDSVVVVYFAFWAVLLCKLKSKQ